MRESVCAWYVYVMNTNESTGQHTATATIAEQTVIVWTRRDLEPPFSFVWCYDHQEWIKGGCPEHNVDSFK